MSAEPEPEKRRKRADEVRERLLTLISEQSLKPGDIVPSERELMAEFGVGRPVVREAMQALQGLGLVEIRHGGRPRVAEPSVPHMLEKLGTSMRHALANSDTTLDNLKEARAVFEAQMARLAAETAAPADVADLKDILDRQAQASASPEEFLTLDGRFHGRIAEMSGNPILLGLSQSLFGWLAEFHSSLVRAPDLEHLTLSEHGAILEAIETGDGHLAAARMSDHLTRANAQYHRKHLDQTRPKRQKN